MVELVALAILWDEVRCIPRPRRHEVEEESIPPPLISRKDIKTAYDDPLNVNLDVIRLAASESGG